MIISVNGKNVNINPTVPELSSYQKHGLNPNDRKPNDYLRMVARTFSSFRGTPATDTVVSYISGFDIHLNETNIVQQVDWLDTTKTYNLFTIKAGACIIDDQLIDIYEDSVFYFEQTEFVANTKYGIVIEYDYLNQRSDNIAKIRFIDYNSLRFPRVGDNHVVDCDFVDTSLSGISNTTAFSGKPGLLIATFATSSTLQIIQSNPPVAGSIVPGIDPQYLSKLYIQNYKLLFEYFGNQARPIFSAMGLTNANFLSVSKTQLQITGDPNTDLRSGDMCYLDPITNKYTRSVASKQEFSKVTGLYINEVNEGNHLIYLSGIVNFDAARHNLPANHTLLNLVPGSSYYLEDSQSLFDSQNQIRTIDNYILSDSSGRISTRYYNAAVQVGQATACNQLVLNFNHTNEISTNNLVELYGNSKSYEQEYENNNIVLQNEKLILAKQDDNTSLTNENAVIQTLLGSDESSLVNVFCTTYRGNKFTTLLSTILPRYFANGSSINEIGNTVLDITNDITNFSTTQQTDIATKISTFSNVKNIKNLLSENISDLNALYNTQTTNLQQWIGDYEVRYTNTNKSILDIDLKVKRYRMGDAFDIVDNFENLNIQSNSSVDYTTEINNLLISKATLVQNLADDLALFKTNSQELNNTQKLLETQQLYFDNISSVIDNASTKIIDNTSTISNNNLIITTATSQRDKAAGNISNNDSLKLDIFMMDDHQRTIFNYTYITDRLQKRLILVDQLSTELVNAREILLAVQNNTQSTIIEKITAIENVNKLENETQQNNNLITNYTTEYNKIRTTYLGITPIIEGELFTDGGYSNDKIGTYRYGCDNYETTYGGLATNLISSTCGPYTSPDSLIVSKNSGFITIDALSNDGHSQGDTIIINSVNTPSHGESILTNIIVHTDIPGTDFTNYHLHNAAGAEIPFIKYLTNTSITFMLTDLANKDTDILNYTILDDVTVIPDSTTRLNMIAYKPTNNYVGNDLFKYSIIDTKGKIATGSINVVVTGPFVTPDTVNVSQNTAQNILDVLSNDGHTTNEKIALLSATQPLHGTISFIAGDTLTNTLGEIKYTPTSNYVGMDSFSYTIIDESLATATGNVQIAIS